MAELDKKIAEKISENPQSLKSRIFKSKGLRLSVAAFVTIILLISALPFLFDNSALKFQIAQKISQISGANFVINGNVRVSFLPSPSITAEDVLLQNYKPQTEGAASEKIYNLYAKSARINFPIFKNSQNIFAKELILTDMILESYDSSTRFASHENKLTAIIAEFAKNPSNQKSKLDSGISAKLFPVADVKPSKLNVRAIKKVTIENGEAIIYDRFARKREIKSIEAHLKISDKKISAAGNFSSENIVSNFKLSALFNSKANRPDTVLEVISPVLSLHIGGNFTSENRGIIGSDFNGKIEAEIFELKSFYKSYVDNSGVISNKLKYNAKPIKISAELSNKSKEIAVKNLMINSSLANGAGSIDLSFVNHIPLIDIDLDLETLDLDSVWSDETVAVDVPEIQPVAAQTEEVEKPAEPTPTLTEEIKDFDLTAEIKVKNVKYLEGEIKDVGLYLTVSKEGEILILPMIFKVPGEGIFRVNGAFDNSSGVPKFVGKFDASGKNLKDVFKWLKLESQNLKFDNLKEYSLYSDILLLPNVTTLNNFYLNLSNDQSEFLGEFSIDNSGKSSNIISRFHVSNFNIDDYFLTSGQNVYLSPGPLIKKLLWLNDISANNDASFSFDKMIYKGEEFPEQSVKLRFGRGYLEIRDLKLKSEKTDLTANLTVDISDKNQEFNLGISANNFHYDISDTAQKNRNFIDQFFALPSLEGFKGKVEINLNNLEIDDLAIQNVKLAGRLKDGSIESSDLTCDLYGGNLAYKGSIGIKQNKIINGNLSFTNASLQPLLSDLIGINNISGVANISASITALASKKEEFAKQLSTEIKFSANSPSVGGYGLNDLVRKMFAPQDNRRELQNPEKILFDPQATTIFKQASGTIQINNGKEGRLRANVTAPAVNGILSGTINAESNSIDALFNAIFLTGSREKQTPINIATNLKGKINAISQSTNLDQVRQYLGLAKVETAPQAQEEPMQEKSQLIQPAPTPEIQPAPAQ